MATLYENYISGDESGAGTFGVQWLAQSFTPALAHTITSVKLKLYRVGLPGTLTVSIRATDINGQPTGADLCSGTTDGDTLTTLTDGEWREITFGAGSALSASTKYAIVFRALNGNASNNVVARKDAVSPTYAGGNYEISGDSGSTWTAYTTNDFMFEDWGNPSFIPRVFII